MKDNKIIKLGLIILTLVALIILIKQNVTATKEQPVEPSESSSALNLEINSELVQNAYKSLILINSRKIDDELYRYSYFNLQDGYHELTNEEKLYIIFENLYSNNTFEKEAIEDYEILKIDTETIKQKALELFKDENFDPLNTNYKSSIECGIIDNLYTGQSYELKYKKCISENIEKTRVESAIKDGNFIRLTIASFYATPNPKNKEEYLVKNYFDDTEVGKFDAETLNNNYNTILDMSDVKRYIFSFELKGDNYYLVNIKEK